MDRFEYTKPGKEVPCWLCGLKVTVSAVPTIAEGIWLCRQCDNGSYGKLKRRKSTSIPKSNAKKLAKWFQEERALQPTTQTKDYPRTASSELGPSWTEVSDDITIVSNEAKHGHLQREQDSAPLRQVSNS